MAENGHVRIGILQQADGELVERSLRRSVERRPVGREENARVEGYLDGVQPVGIGHRFDFGPLDSRQFGLLLLHLAADQRTGRRAERQPYAGTDRSALAAAGQRTDTGADGRAASAADEAAFERPRHRRAAAGHHHRRSARHAQQRDSSHRIFNILISSIRLSTAERSSRRGLARPK